MRKGQATREFIIREAAILFNQKGYFGSSISDLTKITGMQKGGIYNHFENKDELAIEAFKHAVGVLRDRFRLAMEGKSTAYEKIEAVISVYNNAYDDPPLKGGCPVLNTAIECDDSHLELKKHAQQAMDSFLNLLRSLFLEGIERGEFSEDLNAEEMAIYSTSIIEGGVMLSRLYEDNKYIRNNIHRLLKEIANYRKESALFKDHRTFIK